MKNTHNHNIINEYYSYTFNKISEFFFLVLKDGIRTLF